MLLIDNGAIYENRYDKIRRESTNIMPMHTARVLCCMMWWESRVTCGNIGRSHSNTTHSKVVINFNKTDINDLWQYTSNANENNLFSFVLLLLL